MSRIELSGVVKRLGGTEVLTGVDVVVPDGSTTAVLGPSGSGKTTLLRLVAGFERVDAGTVRIAGRVVDDGHRTVHAQHRGIGYVPQEGALFPHLRVRANVGFGLPRRERTRVAELLELVGLAGLGRRFPHQLSGGQQQRVALARALAIRPAVVLLDEPFSSLDASLRTEVRRDVAEVLARTGTTTVLVTHDQDEALALADRIAVLRGGTVVACADPRQLYHEPQDLDAASLLGDANILPARLSGHWAHCALGAVRVHPGGAVPPDGPVRLLIRPEQLRLHTAPVAATVTATVSGWRFQGHDALVNLALPGPRGPALLARVPGSQRISPGQTVWIETLGTARAWPDTDPTRADQARQADGGGRAAVCVPGPHPPVDGG